MATSFNRATVLGNLGSDPDVRTTKNGTKVATMSIATSRKWTDKDGQRQERTTWHRVVAWAELAEIAASVAKKGMRVFADGEMVHEEYQVADGTTRQRFFVKAQQIVAMTENGPRSANSRGFGANGLERAPATSLEAAWDAASNAPF